MSGKRLTDSTGSLLARGGAQSQPDEQRNSSRVLGKFGNSSTNKGKILSSAYNDKKKHLDSFTRMLQDSCDQIIRRFVTDALKYKPDDLLDFASRWVARERGVTLEDVEKDVFQEVIDKGIQLEGEEEEDLSEEHSDQDIQDDLNRGKGDGGEYGMDGDGNGEEHTQNYDIEVEETELKFNLLEVSDENGEEAEQEYRGSDLRLRIARRVNMCFALKHMPVDDRARVILATKEKIVPKGTRIIQQGDQPDHFYLVEEGTFKCLRKYDGDDEEMELKEYLPGDSFGE